MTRVKPAEPSNLEDALDEIAAKCDDDDTPESLTLDEILDSVGRRSYGPLLLVIGLFAISPATIIPGMTWLAAALTLLVAGQMALGMPRIWLPRKALQAQVPRDAVRSGIEKSRGAAKAVDKLLKPRLTFLSKPPFVNLVALMVILAALITFPLGLIPFAPLAPGLAVSVLGSSHATRATARERQIGRTMLFARTSFMRGESIGRVSSRRERDFV